MQYVCLMGHVLRISIFALSAVIYFGAKIFSRVHKPCDTEQQALLGNQPGGKLTSTASGDYGSTNTATIESGVATKSSGGTEEGPWSAAERKTREAIAKRLKQDGNWFIYTKAFTVSVQECISKTVADFSDIPSIHLAMLQQKASIASIACWSLPSCYKCFERAGTEPDGCDDR